MLIMCAGETPRTERKREGEREREALHRISEFLQIFTGQIQALVYLWLENPNIAE